MNKGHWQEYRPGLLGILWPKKITLEDGSTSRGEVLMCRELPDGSMQYRRQTEAEIVDFLDRRAI